MKPAFAAAGDRSPVPHSEADAMPCCGPTEEKNGFREVVEAAYSKVFSVSYAMLGRTEDAEVAVQNVFSRLAGTNRVTAGQPDIIERLYRFAMDYCVLTLRLRHVPDVFARLAGARSVSGLNDARAVATGRVAALAILAVLPPKERALLVLREVADQPVDAVARIMNMKAGEVRNTLLFARRRLLKLCCPK